LSQRKEDKNTNLLKVTIVSVFAVSITVVSLQAQEKRIKRSDLPPAVEKTVAEQTKGATIKGFSTEVENGKTLYEVEMTVNGHGKDISMDDKGNILEVEEDVQMASLPQVVQEGLMKAAGKGTITKVESLAKQGKLVAYEATVKTGTKNAEVQVGPDGKKLSHPQ
jgi:uncharacterized membrane protein YkoI